MPSSSSALQYQNPLAERYASEEMLYNFSPQKKFSTWRKLWLALAQCQQQLGVAISDEQIAALAQNTENIDFEKARAYEKAFRHDVMAHIHTLGDAAPVARPIIHLGATSAFVGDNTDLIQIRDGLHLIRRRLLHVIAALAAFARTHSHLPTLGFTHYQPAQLTTVGKRATLWLQSLLLDWEELEFRSKHLRFRGVKGTTGTGESFKNLFDGDYQKLLQLDEMITERMGFERRFEVSGQTYDRKTDSSIAQLLSNIAQSAHKFTNDIRLLANLKEIEEPFEKKQIGSSAMAYKRNPMRSERIASLAKFVISLNDSAAMVAATQWLERTLDDSANKRLTLPQAFLATDALLILWHNVAEGLVVYPKMMERHIREELPFMATEQILMQAVKNGGDRQHLHEKIRLHSIEAAKKVKWEGESNDLLERIMNDEDFKGKIDEAALSDVLEPLNFVGFAPQQTIDFLDHQIDPLLSQYQYLLGDMSSDLKV